MRRKFLALLLGLALTVSAAVAVPAQDLLSQELDLGGAVVILHTNDMHGRIMSSGSQVGLYQVSGLKNHLEAAGAYVLVLDAGDTLHGLPVATIRQGMDIVEIMNAVGFDAMAPGNHDFNYGQDRLHELGQAMDFPILAANVVGADGEPVFGDHIILERGGLSIGIFGLATQDTPIRTNPRNVEGLSFTNPLVAAQQQVELLQEAGADVIVALSHVGIDEYTTITADIIASQVEGIDIFIDGHSHVAIAQSVPQREDITLAPLGDTVFASTDGHMAQVGVIVINDGEISSTLLDPDAEIPSDEVVEAMISGLVAAQDAVLSEVVGHTDVFLDGERENVRTVETNMGNLATDAILAETGADLVITNGGGIRDSIQAGPITRGDLVTVFPFGNYVVTLEVSGASILEALEHSVSSYPAESGGFLQVSGLKFTFNPEAEAGARVTGAAIGGEALDPEEMYVLATNNFLADGGDGYSMLVGYTMVGMFSSLEQVLIQYIQGNPELVSAAAVEGRIVAETAEVTPEAPEIEESEEFEVDVVTEATPVEEPIVEEALAPVAEEAPSVPALVGAYIVIPGDSLYMIAGSVLGDSSRWPEIYYLNSGLITDPGMIQIGWELQMP